MDAAEAKLDSFDLTCRKRVLRALAATAPPAPADGDVNMHMHSFFSFNAEGWSPSRLAWEACTARLYASALCDFDVFDGVCEFLDAGLQLGTRVAAHLETRVYLREFAEHEITSPGEPGVTYIMAAGVVGMPPAGTPAAAGLEDYRRRARARNESLIARINPHLGPAALDYARDVLPLTPNGNATERHIIQAYVSRAQAAHEDEVQRAAFWGERLGREVGEVRALMADASKFEEVVRARLAKRGGIGYIQPSVDTFPPAEAFCAWARTCGAIPMITWLDGTSSGERDPEALLDCLIAMGCAAINIIPDRNWNIADPGARERKIANLRAIVAASERRKLPINVGTEMNRLGLPFVDRLDGDALRPHREAFLSGARIMVGHSLMARFAAFGYLSEAAVDALPDLDCRNAFFEAVGALPPVDIAQARILEGLGTTGALDWFRSRIAA